MLAGSYGWVKGRRVKKNALRWKMVVEASVAHGGSSDNNLDAFVEDIKGQCCYYR